MLMMYNFGEIKCNMALYVSPESVFACWGCSALHRSNHQKSPQCFWKKRKKFAIKWYI